MGIVAPLAKDIDDEALAVFREPHEFPVHDVERRERLYHQKIADNPALTRLSEVFDTWCDIWFWPGDNPDPIPTLKISGPNRIIVELSA